MSCADMSMRLRRGDPTGEQMKIVFVTAEMPPLSVTGLGCVRRSRPCVLRRATRFVAATTAARSKEIFVRSRNAFQTGE